MNLHKITYEMYDEFPTTGYLTANQAWRRAAGVYVGNRYVGQRVLDELEILANTPWLNRAPLDQGDGTSLWGFQRAITAWQLRMTIAEKLTGWLPEGSATDAVADAYHKRLAGKYLTVRLVDGVWCRVKQREATTRRIA